MTEKIPTWHKQALERGIDFIVLVYEKADGFVFCPSNLGHPFRTGGDYDGSKAVDATSALYTYKNNFSQAYIDRVSWFIEFVEKVRDEKDFSLDDLEIEKRSLKVIGGAWPW